MVGSRNALAKQNLNTADHETVTCKIAPEHVPVRRDACLSSRPDLAAADDQPPYGFSQADAPAQLALEQRFDAALDAQQIGAWLQQLSSGANHVGAPHNKENAEFLLQQFKDWGWQAEIETYDALYPTPKRVALELVAPTTFTAKLSEPRDRR